MHIKTKCLQAAGEALSALPIMWAAMYIHSPNTVAFWPYYVFNAGKGAVQIIAITLSAVADVVEAQQRAGVFSVVMASIALGLVVAAGIGSMLSAGTAANLSVFAIAAVFAATAACVPGALPKFALI
jgi:hypothetical protein